MSLATVEVIDFVIVAAVSASPARTRRGLGGELSAVEGVGEDSGLECSHVGVDGAAGEAGGEDLPSVRDGLALCDDADAAELRSEIEPSDSRED